MPDVTPVVIAAGVAALKQAMADSIRVVYMIAAPFGALACIGTCDDYNPSLRTMKDSMISVSDHNGLYSNLTLACLFIGNLSKSMNYRVEAPVEDLHAKRAWHKEQEKA